MKYVINRKNSNEAFDGEMHISLKGSLKRLTVTSSNKLKYKNTYKEITLYVLS